MSVVLNGRGRAPGTAEGVVLKTMHPFSFFNDVDSGTGVVKRVGSDIFGEALYKRILVIPEAVEDCLSDETISVLNFYKGAPAAIVAGKACDALIESCVEAGIPLVEGIDCASCRTGDSARVDGDEGTVELANVSPSSVVTSVLFNSRGELLIVRRSSRAGSHAGTWACISGYVEEGEAPEKAALRELKEETGVENVECVRRAEPLAARDDGKLWMVHPFAVLKNDADIVLDEENTEYRWAKIEEVEALESSGDTVPRLAETVRRASYALRTCRAHR